MKLSAQMLRMARRIAEGKIRWIDDIDIFLLLQRTLEVNTVESFISTASQSFRQHHRVVALCLCAVILKEQGK